MTEILDLGPIEERLAKATPGPLSVAIINPELDGGKWFERFRRDGPDTHTWVVWAPEHPDTVIGSDSQRPDHAIVSAITGNGPTSEANAGLYASTPTDLAACIAEIKRLRVMLVDGPRDCLDWDTIQKTGLFTDSATYLEWYSAEMQAGMELLK